MKMTEQKLYAVITGDVVHSSRLRGERWSTLVSLLDDTFGAVGEIVGSVAAPFSIHRGDSFQGVLSDPALALKAALVIRARLRSGLDVKRRSEALDAYIAIGIGTVDYLPEEQGAAGDGDAFRRSGKTLDGMKGRGPRLLVRTPWPEVDAELDVECSLLEGFAADWSRPQAEALLLHLQGRTQAESASMLHISQPAVTKRLLAAGAGAVDDLLGRYERVITSAVSG
ncbi:MAG: hypothetical protein ACOC9B_00665 [Chloroflexota bacterium]